MQDGFVKIAAATSDVRVADCAYNAAEIVKQAKQATERGAHLIVFPELSLTGYTCGDLFLQETLLRGALHALKTVRDQTADLNAAIVVGLPLVYQGKIYNVAAVLSGGRIEGIIPKQYIPDHSAFHEKRYFASGAEVAFRPFDLFGEPVLFGGAKNGEALVFRCEARPDFTFGVEIGEDLWAATAPSVRLAQSGATVIVNLSASSEVVGAADYRRALVEQQSARLLCAYAFANAGMGESTQDLVFAGRSLIAENGVLFTEGDAYAQDIIYADIDVQRLTHDRRRTDTFEMIDDPIVIELRNLVLHENDLQDRVFSRTPFVPTNDALRDIRCNEILSMQVAGLATRLRHTHAQTAVIGLSGGLDSTLALIVTVHAFDLLGLDRKGITAVTMPCFGTTARTRGNAEKLAEAYGVQLRTVDIKASVDQHFCDIGQSKEDLSVTFENAQARMRTLVLMNLANKEGGMVVGTGDLSELALGWATYNGDHMSMYGVNASIPKTLVRYLAAYEASCAPQDLAAVLQDILDTPVSPELLPPKDGEISQKTEDLVGPYELHDFFLYHMLRFGASPRKIYRIACIVFADTYDKEEIKKWLSIFIRRFFTQQFKRSCLPDGPKVGTVGLSPRGDWCMPSDACATLWLDEVESL